MDTKEKRRIEIAEFVNENRSVTFQQIKNRFPDVSDMTLRTDLKELDDAKKILRIHGGAKSIEEAFGNDDLLNNRLVRNIEAKQIIAKKAAEHIEKNQTVFIDSGSTTTMMAKALRDQHNTFYTNGISVAMEMTRLTQADVYVAGGSLNHNSASTNGNEALEMFTHMNFDLAVIGVTHYDATSGFTCESRGDFLIKRSILERSAKVMVVLDSSKVLQPKRGTYTICQLQDVDVIVSDGSLPEDFIQECQKEHVEVM